LIRGHKHFTVYRHVARMELFPKPSHTSTHTHTHTCVCVRASRYGVKHSKKRWTSLQLKGHQVGDQQLCMVWKILLPVYSELKHLNIQRQQTEEDTAQVYCRTTDLEGIL